MSKKTPARVATSQQLREAGLSYEAIGQRLGVSRHTAWRWVNPEGDERMKRRRSVDRGSRNRLAQIRRKDLRYRIRQALTGSKQYAKRKHVKPCLATVEEVLQTYNGHCFICGVVEWDAPKSRLHIDHCHLTGRFRGWLCDRCNRGLGYFRDNPTLLEKSIEYLKIPPSGI